MDDSPQHAQSLPSHRRRFATGKSLLILVVIALVYTYGWRITTIDLTQFGNVSKIFPIVKAMFTPSIFERNVETVSTLTPFAYPSEKFKPPDEHLVLSAYQGARGDTIHLEGRKLPANRSGMLKWIALGKESREVFLTDFTTGPGGRLKLDITVPETATLTNLVELRILEMKTLPYFCQQCFIVPSAADMSETSGPVVEMSVYTGGVGDLVTLEGFGFEPGAIAEMYWISGRMSTEPIFCAKVDSLGRIKGEMPIPKLAGEKGKETTLQYLETITQKSVGGLFTWKPTNAAKDTFNKIIETVFLALMATTLAVFITVPLSFLAAANVMKKNKLGTAIYYIVRGFLNIVRSVEPLIMAMVFSIWVGIGPFAGVLALAVHSVAALGKLYSEQIEDIDQGPIDAIMATGASRLQVIRYGIIPQIVPSFLAFTIYRWDINVRMSTIIGFVGGGGIGFILQQWINQTRFHEAGTALWAIAIVVFAMDIGSAKIRERLL